MTMTAKKKKILSWSVLMLAIILRCIRFGSVPDGINQDEAMGAMDAWALSKHGTDRYGTSAPLTSPTMILSGRIRRDERISSRIPISLHPSALPLRVSRRTRLGIP